MQVYHAHDVSRNGEFFDYSITDAVCFKRHNNQKSLWCIINTKNSSYHIDVPSELQGVQTAELLSGDLVSFSSTFPVLPFGVYLFILP